MAAGAGVVRAGRAFVELFANNNALYRGLEQARKKLQTWAAQISKIGVRAGIAGTAAAAPLLKLLSDFAGRGNAIKQISDRFRSTTETVSKLAYGFELAGGSLDEFGGAVDSIADKISALENSEELFGDRLRGLTGGMLRGQDIGTQLDMIAEKFRTIVDAEDQVAVAGQLGLSRLLPWLKKGKAGLDELRAAAEQGGGVLSADEAARSEKWVKALNQSWLELRSTLLAVGEALLPTSGATGELQSRIAAIGASVRRWIADNGGLIASVAAVSAGLVAGGIALGLLSKALLALSASLGLVTVGLKAVAAALALALSPVGLVVAGIAGIGAALVTQTETGREAIGTLGGLFKGLGETATTAWGGIVAAVQSGDLAAAGKIALLGLQTAWAQVVAGMTKIWNDFKAVVVDTFRDIKDEIRRTLNTTGGRQSFALGFLGGGITSKTAKAVTEIDPAYQQSVKESDERRERDRAARQADLDAAIKEAADLQAELNRIVAQAAQKRRQQQLANIFPDAGSLLFDREQGPAPRAVANVNAQLPQLFAAAKGGFGGPIQAQFGYGDNIAKRQLDAAQNTADNTAVLPAIDQKIGQLNNALRFTR